MKRPEGGLTHKLMANAWFPDSSETAEDNYFVQAVSKIQEQFLIATVGNHS